MAEEKESLTSRFLEWVRENHERQPNLGAQLEAMWREARKDIHSVLERCFFGQPTGPGEPGSPLVPTQSQVSRALGVPGYRAMLEDAAARAPAAQQPERGVDR